MLEEILENFVLAIEDRIKYHDGDYNCCPPINYAKFAQDIRESIIAESIKIDDLECRISDLEKEIEHLRLKCC